jgi:hypothetical protein
MKETRPIPADAARLLDRFSEEVHEIILRLRDRILALAPDVHEIISDVGYTVSLQYGPDDKVSHAFCYIAAFSKHANLGFQHGASFPDPQNALAGTGAFMRHIKFLNVEQTQAPWLDAYLHAALARSHRDLAVGADQITARAQASRRKSSGVRNTQATDSGPSVVQESPPKV